MAKVPPLTVVPPVYVLTPVRTSVPEPESCKAIAAWAPSRMAPENVVVEFVIVLKEFVPLAPELVIRPAPLSDPTWAL